MVRNVKLHKGLFINFTFWFQPLVSERWCSHRGKPLSGEYTSTELSTPEPSVSLHLAAPTRAALGIIAVTFHHSIKDFPVSWTAGAGAGSGRYSYPLSFLLSFLPFFLPSWRHRLMWIWKSEKRATVSCGNLWKNNWVKIETTPNSII